MGLKPTARNIEPLRGSMRTKSAEELLVAKNAKDAKKKLV